MSTPTESSRRPTPSGLSRRGVVLRAAALAAVPTWGRWGSFASLTGTVGFASLVGSPPARAADEPQPRPWPADKPVPPLALPALEGPTIDLVRLRGKVVVLNFWASWCEPCREELPSLELLATRHAAQGLEVLLVNFRETDRAIRRFLEAQPVSLPILRDGDGAAAKDWGVRIYPSTFVIDRQGRVAFSVIGEVDWVGASARGWLAPLLAAAR